MPVTAEAFFAVFRSYNEAVGPAPVLLTILGFVALGLVLLRARLSGPVICGILALLWAWAGLAYHLVFFRAINALAPLFALAFVAQATMFVWYGMAQRRLQFQWSPDLRGALAAGLGVYALVAYPAVALALRGDPLEVAGFGLPCPTTIFTVAMLGFLRPGCPRRIFVIPMLWAVFGFQAKWLLGVYEDLVLAGALAAALWFALRPIAPGRTA